MKDILDKMKSKLLPEYEYEDEYEEEYEQQEFRNEEQYNKSVGTLGGRNMSQSHLHSAKGAEVFNVKVDNYSKTGEVAQLIKSKKLVVANMTALAQEEVQRAVDYLAGATFSLNGTIDQVDENIFMFAPEAIRIDSSSQKSNGKNNLLDKYFN